MTRLLSMYSICNKMYKLYQIMIWRRPPRETRGRSDDVLVFPFLVCLGFFFFCGTDTNHAKYYDYIRRSLRLWRSVCLDVVLYGRMCIYFFVCVCAFGFLFFGIFLSLTLVICHSS